MNNTPNMKSYELNRCTYSKQRTVTYPKCALSRSVEQIREFTDSQQLYYYLTWTNKMQAIDGEFIEYTFGGNHQYGKIAIFNAELHDTNSNAMLYIVAVLNNKNERNDIPFQWKMNAFMTADEICNIYGINKNDLPIGSRQKHNYWNPEIYKQQNQLISLHPNIYISSLHKTPFIRSQQYKYKNNKNNKSYFKEDDINKAIQESINNIRNNTLSLIPILKINTKKQEICCQCLLPIKLQNESKWIAVSYQLTTINNNTKSIVTGLYIDAQDIINKSLLLSPSAIDKYQFLKGEQTPNINSLQQQLNEALKRESMWLLMLQQKDQIIQSLINNANNKTKQTVQNINVYGIPMISTPPFPLSQIQIPSVIPLISPNNNTSSVVIPTNVTANYVNNLNNFNNIYPNIINGQQPVLSKANS